MGFYVKSKNIIGVITYTNVLYIKCYTIINSYVMFLKQKEKSFYNENHGDLSKMKRLTANLVDF